MTNDRVTELEKEVRELNLKLEIERQKVRKLEQENQKLKDKMSRQVRSERPLRVAAAPMPSTPSPGGNPTQEERVLEGGGVSEGEIEELREKLRKFSTRKDSSEQEKWDQSKEVIEHKETLQRLRVKKINIKKDIDDLNERLDRKENQNFKSRLEITDLKKEERKFKNASNFTQSEREKLEVEKARLEASIETEKEKLRVEKRARDKVQFAVNRAVKIKAEYESHFMAKLYNK
jgi:DNA repair exonuclease SbcCD ATPase subunit